MTTETILLTKEDVEKDIEASGIGFMSPKTDDQIDVNKLFMFALDMVDNVLLDAIQNLDIHMIDTNDNMDEDQMRTTAGLIAIIGSQDDASEAINCMLFSCYMPGYSDEPVQFSKRQYEAWVKYIDRIVKRYPDPDLFQYRLELFKIDVYSHRTLWNTDEKEALRRRYEKWINVYASDLHINRNETLANNNQ